MSSYLSKSTLIALISILLFSCAEPTKKGQTAEIPEEKIDTASFTEFGISVESIANLGKIEKGSQAPDFKGKDQNGETIHLSNILKDEQVVLIFYRGYWCPYCTKHLASFVDNLDTLKSLNTRIIAIAPEGSKNTLQTAEKTGLDISFISDSSNEILNKYGVGFTVNDAYNKRFSDWKGVTIAEENGQESGTLPIPATFIIGKDGIVKWSHFDPDYSNRSTIEDILANI